MNKKEYEEREDKIIFNIFKIFKWIAIIIILLIGIIYILETYGFGGVFSFIGSIISFFLIGLAILTAFRILFDYCINNNAKINEIKKVQHTTFNLLIKIEKDLQQLKYK
jgi:hypothetical protein